ncbi:DUF1493 family protein [Candidatus Poribacteria bacterium]|nr:DUF1493 family protein [Candidatus Poribacteria bacterium]
MNDTILARVKAFVAEHHRIAEKKFNPDTRLLEDLGIDGDDGVELIEAFCEEFEIDPSTIHISEYFGPEGCDLIGSLFGFLYDLLFDKEKLRSTSTPITLHDLAESAQAKRWIPPQGQPKSPLPPFEKGGRGDFDEAEPMSIQKVLEWIEREWTKNS